MRMQGAAGERLADVYVGVDVFARGNVVGGRFDTNKVGGGPGGRGGGQWPPRGPARCGPFTLTPLEGEAGTVILPKVGNRGTRTHR